MKMLLSDSDRQPKKEVRTIPYLPTIFETQFFDVFFNFFLPFPSVTLISALLSSLILSPFSLHFSVVQSHFFLPPTAQTNELHVPIYCTVPIVRSLVAPPSPDFELAAEDDNDEGDEDHDYEEGDDDGVEMTHEEEDEEEEEQTTNRKSVPDDSKK